MSEPASWQLIEALVQRLQTVRSAAGFHSELGADVRSEAYALEELGGELSLRAYVYATSASRDAANSGPRTKKDQLTLSIDAMVPGYSLDAQRQAHRVLADIRRALDAPARDWLPAGIATGVQIETQSFEQRPGSLRLIVVQLGLTATVTEVQATA